MIHSGRPGTLVLVFLEILNYEQKIGNVGLGGSIVTKVIEKCNGVHKCCPL